MDLVKKFQAGYGKIDNLEDQNPPQQSSAHLSPFATAALSAILLLTLAIGLIIGLIIIQSSDDSHESHSLTSDCCDSVKIVCNFTSYPDSCVSSLSSVNTPPKHDPEWIFKLSLEVSAVELRHLSSELKESNGGAALAECESLIEDAVSRVNDSVNAMAAAPGEMMLTEAKIGDIQTWVSAAMTDRETCLDGLGEMESPELDEVKKKMQRSKEYLSNCLAIVANMHALLDKFCMHLH